MEQKNIDWKYVTLLSNNKDTGGYVEHDELEVIEENACNHSLIKMAGEAIVRMYFCKELATLSGKKDRDDVTQFIKAVNPYISERNCIRKAVASNIKYFRRPEIRRMIKPLVQELIKRNTMTRPEYQDFVKNLF